MKHFKIIIAVFLGLLSLLFFFSCKKDSEPIHHTIPDILKAYYLFQPGSYWIYQNTKTSQIDCTYIDVKPEFYQQQLVLDDKSVFSITDYCVISFKGHIFHSCSMNYNDVQFDYFMTYNLGVSTGESMHYYNNYFFENITFYDSLAVNNYYYSNVRVTKDSHLPYHDDTTNITMKVLSAKNIGIVQTTITKNTCDSTWNLIRFHVIQ